MSDQPNTPLDQVSQTNAKTEADAEQKSDIESLILIDEHEEALGKNKKQEELEELLAAAPDHERNQRHDDNS